ncbi:MAG: exosome complex protein Rrp42 [Candidatus Thermoplasmatota archaeon]|nr:exosome complex protein Rrp42 [Candidatus Thermoplasmatota archaeon]
MSSDSVSNLMKGHMESLAAEGKRADGRSITEFREVKIETGMINTAEGSAMVHLGKTKVLCGIKLLIGTPYGDSPASGTMTTSTELAPLADQSFDPGPPREASIELARVVDRGIRESRMIDFEALCIEHGERVWMVYIDLHILDNDGNLFDCCTLAAAAALSNAKIPNVQHGVADEDVDLPVTCWPISCTFGKLGDTVILDPTSDEESVMTARLTVAHDEDGNIRAAQKGMNGAFTDAEVREAVKTARKSDNVLREALKGL